MPRYLVHYEGEGTGPSLIEPAPEVGDTISHAGQLWSVEKVQAPTSSPAMGRVWAKRDTSQKAV